MNFTNVKKNLEKRGFDVSCFDTKEDAAKYIAAKVKGQNIGIGGSVTVEEMGLYDMIAEDSHVFWHWRLKEGESAADILAAAARAEVYLTSANGIAETGEIINIDGTGNRVAATFYGHKKVYIIVGENKIAPDYDSTLLRARNVASPLNAKRLGRKTPCAVKGDKCYNCDSPDRICRGLSVFWEAPYSSMYEVILVHEKLGY